MVTNSRNGSIFSNNIIKANAQLGNNTDIFELDYNQSVQKERERLLAVIENKSIDTVLFLNDFRFPDQTFLINETISQQVDCRLWVWDAMHDINDLKNHIYLYSKIYSFEINDILQLKKYYLGFSAIMILISIIFFLTIKLNLGVDFKGGDLLQLHYSKAINKENLNSALDSLINEVPQLKSKRLQYSEDNTIVLRTEQLNETQKNLILNKLTEKTGKYELVKYDTVGPTIGKGLTSNALTALLIGSLLIIIYITIRFEFVYAVAGVAAVLHDVIIAMGLVAFLKYEINTPFIAAILTILGYSMNDTIVVFDRIRENDAKDGKTKTFDEIIEESVNQVYMRSLFTSLTTLLSITVLLIFGGDSLRTFNTALFIGMIFGTYSSIFVASPLVYLMRKYRKKKKDDGHHDKNRRKQRTVNGYDEDEKVLV